MRDYINGGFSDLRRIHYQLKSVSLRTNEELVRLYNDAAEAYRLFFQQPDYFEGVMDMLHLDNVAYSWQSYRRLRESIIDVDQLMKRVEKKALFSEILARIMLKFEKEVFPLLRDYRLFFEDIRKFYDPLWEKRVLTDQKNILQDFVEAFAESVSSGIESGHKVVVSALALLSFVYQYLIGCVDKGGSKTYSPGSFLFRLIFVAIVLFLGSYVWIKSRPASFTANRRKRKLGDVPGSVYPRVVKITSGSVKHYKYEPRFKPLREKLESGASLELNRLSLGSYDTRREAEIVLLIAAVLYGEVEGRPVEFEDGLCLPFPSVTELENCPPSGEEKVVWVTHKTKELYAELLREKARQLQLLHLAVDTGSHHGHAGKASRRGPSPSASGAPSTAMELAYLPSPHGGNGVVEQPTTSESHGLGQEALLAREVFPAIFSDSDFDQFISSMLQPEDNDIPAVDQIEGDSDRVFCVESTSVRPQSSALDIPTIVNFASQPQLGVGDQGLEIIEPHLNSAAAITAPHMESLPEQVQLQQHVTYHEQRPEGFSGSNVALQQKLLEYEERISELQERNSEQEQELRQAKVETENLRSMFHQVVKLISASNLFGYPVDL